jgi:hypothetical protein
VEAAAVSDRPRLRVTVEANEERVELFDQAAALVVVALTHREQLNAIDVFKAVAHFAHGKAHLQLRRSSPPIRFDR